MKELKEIIEYTLDAKLPTKDLTLLDEMLNTQNDFVFEIDGGEYRFISDNLIEDIYHDEQMELIEDCFLGGKELPSWIEIDWDKTIDNVYQSDGYGNHFSTYDGSEETFNYDEETWYIFRVN